MAALRYLDRNAVRAGLVKDPTTYPWSRCAAYALGTSNPVITLHPRYLALRPYAKERQRQYRTLLAPTADPPAEARDARWTTQRAVGSPAFMASYVPRWGRRRMETLPLRNQEVSPNWCPIPFSTKAWRRSRGTSGRACRNSSFPSGKSSYAWWSTT